MLLNYLLKSSEAKTRFTDIWKGKKEREFTREEAVTAGKKLGVNWSKVPLEQLRKGMSVELEHGKVMSKTDITGNDPTMSAQIALSHILECNNYYDRLERLEEKAKQDSKRGK